MVFKSIIPVPYYELNNHQEASAVAILNYLEETAIRHSETVGCGIESLLENGWGWLLTRWSLHMEKYPKWNEQVQIETWPFKFQRFYATREFKITNKKGEFLGAATTLWVFFNLNRKRPGRIPEEITSAYGTGPVRMVEDDFLELPELNEPDEKIEFRVRFSDIDSNDHVNNKKYVEWLIETIPVSVHREYFLSALEVVYKKETKYGSMVICEIEEDSIGDNKRFLHRVLDKETGNELARARTTWDKR